MLFENSRSIIVFVNELLGIFKFTQSCLVQITMRKRTTLSFQNQPSEAQRTLIHYKNYLKIRITS